MITRKPSSYLGTFAAITWGWIVAVLVLLLSKGFSGGYWQIWRALTSSLPLLFIFFCLPLLAFADSTLLAIRMSRGDMRDRPLAIILLVIGVPWALAQTFAVLVGL